MGLHDLEDELLGVDARVVDGALGAGQADLGPEDRGGVGVHEQVVVAQPRHGTGDRGLAADPIQPVQPAGLLGHEEEVPATHLAVVDDPAQERLVGDHRAVRERDDRLVDRPELRLGEDADLDGHAAPGELDGERGAVSKRAVSAAPSTGGSVTTRTASVSAAVSSRASRWKRASSRRPPRSSRMSTSWGDEETVMPIAFDRRETVGRTWPMEVASRARVAAPGPSQFWRQPQPPPQMIPTPSG